MRDVTEKANGQRRLCRLMTLLAGHEFEGLRPGELAKALDTHPSNITRDLQVLADEGMVERVPGLDDRVRLGPRLVQIAVAHQAGLARIQTRVAEINQRYSRSFGTGDAA